MITICFYKEKDNQMNILWVEDIPDNKQNFWFGNRRNVETVRDFSKAKEIIQTKLNNYDVVILDIDLQESSKTDDVKALAQVFGLSDHDFLKKSGMHLCLNLLESGFPREQIVFLTANADRPNRLGRLIEILKSDDVNKAKKATEEIFKTLADDQREELKKFDSKKAKLEYLTKLIPEKSIENLYDNFCEAYKAACLIPPDAISKSIENEAQRDLSDWLEAHERNEYLVLRRGIIDACIFLKNHITNDDNIQLNRFIKGASKGKPTMQILKTDIESYLDTLVKFLPVRKPEAINEEYRLFLRTLVHEWEGDINPEEIIYTILKKIKNDRKTYDYEEEVIKSTPEYESLHGIHTFAWLSRQTRNWVSHAKLLEPLDSEIIAFLFLVNMRAMFKLPPDITLSYEHILLKCMSKSPVDIIDDEELKAHIERSNLSVNKHVSTLKISEYKEDYHRKDIVKDGNKKPKTFMDKINAIYSRNTIDIDYKSFLFQYFWVNQKENISELIANTDDFLPTLARHIYTRSFS